YRYGQMAGCPDKFNLRYDLVESLHLPPFRIGTILSGDCFFHQKDKVQAIIEKHFSDDDVLGLDMETAALAQSAYFFKKDFIVIRAVSDLIGSALQNEDYNRNLERACQASNLFLLEFLKNIK
ncbi:MAG: hypothetical protein PHV87_04865, partial [Bacilli bacterium]|nr:hypothetical protein [Bacilli bacterium]